MTGTWPDPGGSQTWVNMNKRKDYIGSQRFTNATLIQNEWLLGLFQP